MGEESEHTLREDVGMVERLIAGENKEGQIKNWE